MKKAYIVHGWDGSPNEPMLQWLKLNLEKAGWEVTNPEMPDPDVPTIEKWVGRLREVITPDENTVLIGHSIGCQAVLRYVETLPENTKIPGIVLIAPWMELDEATYKEEGEESREIARPWTETPINWKKVKSHIGKAVAIFSDDDPYVPLTNMDNFKEKLGAETIPEHAKGHFSPGDNITELPSALEAIKGMVK